MDREKLINAIIEGGDFKWEERAYMVDNGLGALAIFFASDFECDADGNVTQKSCVGDKARQSVAYALSLADDDVFNAIRYIPECVNETNANDFSYLTIGLYVMLADAVSRKYDATDKKLYKTFFQACREEGLELDKTQQKYNKKELQAKFEKVLKNLGLKDEFPNLAETWSRSAQFTFLGIPNGQVLEANAGQIPENAKAYTRRNKYDEKRTDIVFGPYAMLGMLISETQKLLGVNTAISYALGNRDNQSNIKNEGDDRKLENVLRAINSKHILQERMIEGDTLRAERMVTSARRHLGDRMIQPNADVSVVLQENTAILEQKQKIIDANAQQNANRNKIEEILGYFPDNFLQIAHQENYTYVYSQKENIRDVYPEGEIPGFTEAESELTRSSNGGNLSRYKFMAISLGDRQELKGTENEMRAAAQTAIHETMHSVIHTLKTKKLITEEELDKIYRLASSLSIQDTQTKSVVITTNSFAEIVNPQSLLYRGYADNIKAEEVLCNVYSLWHTEPNRDNSPLNTPEVLNLINAVQAAANRLLAPKEAARSDNLLDVRISAEGTGTPATPPR